MPKLIETAEELETICKTCNAKISYSFGDITYTYNDSGSDYYHIKCPGCKQKHYVPKWKSLPESTKKESCKCADKEEIPLSELKDVYLKLKEFLLKNNVKLD